MHTAARHDHSTRREREAACDARTRVALERLLQEWGYSVRGQLSMDFNAFCSMMSSFLKAEEVNRGVKDMFKTLVPLQPHGRPRAETQICAIIRNLFINISRKRHVEHRMFFYANRYSSLSSSSILQQFKH